MELDTRTKAAIQMLTNQRNQALDNTANLVGEVAALQEELEALRAQLAAKTEVPK